MSEALRDARTAEAAAAEDFDPLRIRPYVELDGGVEQERGAEREADPGETMPLRAAPPAGPASGRGPVDPSAAPPTAPPSPGTTSDARDLSLFEPGTAAYGAEDGSREPGSRRGRTVLLGVGGGLVAVLAAAGLASGLFAYETPSRDRALPKEVRASVPAPPTSQEAETPAPAGTSPRPAPAPVTPSAPRSASASPSPSGSSASPSPSTSATEKATSTPSPSGAAEAQEQSSPARETAPPTLRRGDRGPEVLELELRLTQLGLYAGEAKSTYDEGVEEAVARYQWARGVQPKEYGVYDAVTRERLEAETREP
ncbi:peptidoglycan-binding protein [Streptomyces sp. NPDC007808]|uniref:peptidoglycan-binding domain-containing protein n=1 Tax=Streptomyces sp. NPDC007808 TaxID=3364779 RepID=UPI0036830A4A